MMPHPKHALLGLLVAAGLVSPAAAQLATPCAAFQRDAIGAWNATEPLTVIASVSKGRIEIEVFDPNGKVSREVAGSPSEIDTEDLPFDRILALPIVRGLVDEVGITQEDRGARMRMVVSLAATAESPPSG